MFEWKPGLDVAVPVDALGLVFLSTYGGSLNLEVGVCADAMYGIGSVLLKG